MTTGDVQARASVFCTEERHARLEAELVQYAFQVAKLERETAARVYDMRVTRAVYVSIAIPCCLAAMAAAAAGAAAAGLLLLLAAFLGWRGWVLADQAIYAAGRVVALHDLPRVLCPHMEATVETFLVGMGGVVERSRTGGCLATKTRREPTT